LLISCNDEQEVVTQNSSTGEKTGTVWYVGMVNDELAVQLEDGEMIFGENALQSKILLQDLENSKGLTILFDEQSRTTDEYVYLAGVRIPFGLGYSIRLSAETGFLGSCIGRTVPHVGVSIGKEGYSGTIANLHIAVWTQNGKACGAVMASRNNQGLFCVSFCNPSFSDISNAVRNALTMVGIPYLLAYSMAYIITLASLAMLPIGL